MGVIKNTILGIVGLAVVGGATAMAIPQSRNWCLDQIAKHSTIYKTAINERDDARADAQNKQETINKLNDIVAEKEKELKEANALIDTKNALIAEKDADIAEKQKAIEAKDAEIAEKQSTIDEQSANINTLNSQKTSLLSAVTEIDNKANSTSDSVEIDNLEARKTEILVRIDSLNDLIADATKEKAKLQSDVDALTKEKVALQDEVNELTSDKTQLQQEVATLTTEKQNLQSQIDSLNSQLAEFEQYTLNIDQTNPVESITIEDTKLGTSATMSNVNITTLNLYSWQNATIKYASVDGATVKATLNGTMQDTDTVTIVGSNNKGASISIGSATQPIGKVAGLYKTGTDELTKSWSQLMADGDVTVTDGAFKVANKSLEGDLVCDKVEGLTSLNQAFYNCSKLSLIDLSNFETSQVADVSDIFKNDSSLIFLDISNFDFSSVKDYVGMFDSVLGSCEILVKDESAKTWLNTNFPKMIIVKIKTKVTGFESNLKMALVGTVDDKQTMLCFNDASYASNLMQKQTSDGDFICIGKLGFVSWDDSTKTLTFKNIDNNENIVLTNVEISKQFDGSFHVGSGTWNGIFFGC